MFLSALLGSFVASSLFTGAFLWLARKYRLVARPNERSAHLEPTPTSGGIGWLLAMVVMVFVLKDRFSVELLITSGVCLAVGLLGFIDDLKELDAAPRLLLVLLAASVGSYTIGGLQSIQLFDVVVPLAWLAVPTGALLVVYIINIYNFMDGIDGIAGLEALFVFAAVGIWLLPSGDLSVAMLALTAAAAMTGFLCFNLPPARLFMGDVGSYAVGALLGFLLLYTVVHTSLNIWSWCLLLGVFLADSTLTLVVRLMKGENVLAAHNIHAYQHAARRWGVVRTLLLLVIINVMWLLPLALLATLQPDYGFALTALGYAPVLIAAWFVGAGQRPGSV